MQILLFHHIKHWAEGGATNVSNGVCLCSHLYNRKGGHKLVHEGGYIIQCIDNNDHRLKEQFAKQQRRNDLSMFDFEIRLRNSKESFNAVRTLSTTRYRFRIFNANGKDILDLPNTDFDDAQKETIHTPHNACAQNGYTSALRVYACRLPRTCPG